MAALRSHTFIPTQATPFPIDGDKEVNMTVTIGPKAKKTDGNSNSTYDTWETQQKEQ